MKYIIRILPVLLCTFLFTTCDSEDRYVEEIQHEINFILPTTRSTQTGMFEVGDDIGVFAVERTNESQVGSIVNPKYVNLQYRYNGTQFVPVGQKVQYSGKKYDFYVYSPYNSTYTNIGQLSHSVSANQNKDNWESSDLCTAINTTGIATGNVQLDFAHKFATVKIIVDNDVKAVDLLQVQTLGLLSFATNQAHPQGSRSNVAMYKESPGNFLATIPVQQLSGTVFKITKSNNSTVDFKLSSPKNLIEGVNVIYTISLKANIELQPADNGKTSGGGEYQTGDTCTVSATPDPGYDFEGWYENGNKVSTSPNYTFPVTGDRVLTPKFKSSVPVETWVYYFSVQNWSVFSPWGASSHNTNIASYKVKYLNGHPTNETIQVAYNVQSSSSWISASNNSDHISWDANPNTSSRIGTVTWRQEESGKTDYAQVNQEGKPADVITTEVSYEISVDPTAHTFASTGGSKTFTVKLYKVTKTFTNGVLTNTQRTPQTSGWSSSVSGVGFSRNGDTVTASVNNSTSPRNGTFTASYQGVSASASLYQEGDDESEIIIN